MTFYQKPVVIVAFFCEKRWPRSRKVPVSVPPAWAAIQITRRGPALFHVLYLAPRHPYIKSSGGNDNVPARQFRSPEGIWGAARLFSYLRFGNSSAACRPSRHYGKSAGPFAGQSTEPEPVRRRADQESVAQRSSDSSHRVWTARRGRTRQHEHRDRQAAGHRFGLRD